MTLASSAVGHGAGIENGTDYLGTRSPRLVTKQSAGGKTPLHDLLQLDQGFNPSSQQPLGYTPGTRQAAFIDSPAASSDL